jgi:hypothetical protein
MRSAVVKSGLRSCRLGLVSEAREKSIARSTTPPLAIRPTVGTPCVKLLLVPEAAMAPV